MTSLAFDDAAAFDAPAGRDLMPPAAGRDPASRPAETGIAPRQAREHRDIAPAPRIAIDAFCESEAVAVTIEAAARDRLMARATVSVQAGGIAAAIAHCRAGATPNLVIVENVSAEEILTGLDALAEACDPTTRVMVIGHSNDILFYRDLMKRGVSEYLLVPVDPLAVIAAVSNVYRAAEAPKLGRSFAFIGAKGGVGSSTIAHNVAWAMGRGSRTNVVLADLDLPFGTVGLDYNLDGGQGMAGIVTDTSRLDEVLLERLLTDGGNHVSLLTTPATLELAHDLPEAVFDGLLEVAQAHVPSLVLDLPHLWSAWSRRVLTAVDDIVITAEPDLANLRNAKNLVALLKQERPNDPAPKLVLNRVGVPKRPELKPKDFVDALGIAPLALVPFEPRVFGKAANNGQMVGQLSARGKPVEAFERIARALAGREEAKRRRFALTGGGLAALLKGRRKSHA